MRKTLIIILLAYLSVVLMPAWGDARWLIYRKPEFKGKVVDAETKEPIKGAVVVVMYYSSPIITGPGGGSSYIIHVKETLTDENGVFVIPSYSRLIQPNSLEGRVEFIIYKPGYGSFPNQPVKPDPPIYLEKFFAEEIGSEGEFVVESRKETKKFPVTFGVVELLQLKTREERLKTTPPPPTDFIKDTPLLYEAINDERKYFELKPVGR
jgi:hypothetical protein